MAKEVDVVVIRAKVESATPDRTQWKPYATTLSFDELYIDVPVPAQHVRKEKDKTILSLEGWTIFLDVYSTMINQMHARWTQSFTKPGQHRPY